MLYFYRSCHFLEIKTEARSIHFNKSRLNCHCGMSLVSTFPAFLASIYTPQNSPKVNFRGKRSHISQLEPLKHFASHFSLDKIQIFNMLFQLTWSLPTILCHSVSYPFVLLSVLLSFLSHLSPVTFMVTSFLACLTITATKNILI